MYLDLIIFKVVKSTHLVFSAASHVFTDNLMNPTSLTRFNFTGQPEPFDATCYCTVFAVTVFCFWQFQACARLYRNFVQCTTEPTQREQRTAKFMEYFFLFLTYIFFDMLCQGSEGFVFGSLNVIIFFVFVYIYLETMGYLPTFIQSENDEI